MKRSIMVVDDSRFIYEEMKRRLGQSEEFEILHYCPDGETALEAYGQYHPDLVTVDIVMPGIDGIETTRRLREQYPEVRVVVVTSLVFDDTIEEAMQAGAKGFLAKPFEQQTMLESFRAAFVKQS